MTNISLLDKEKCTIVVLETITPMQNIYVSSFIDLDFKFITPFSDLNDIIKHIKDNHVDWCILSLDHLVNINLLDLFEALFKSSKNESWYDPRKVDD